MKAGRRLYRGTDEGRIYTSANSGRSWQPRTDFGAGISVWGLSAGARGGLRAELGFACHSIHLSLMQNGKTWRTDCLVFQLPRPCGRSFYTGKASPISYDLRKVARARAPARGSA
jgi:hypothetical protein